LDDWLRTPSPPNTGYRDEVYLKLSAAARCGPDTFTDVVARERQALFGELHTLRQLASRETDDLVTLLIDGASLQVQARIELLDRADQLAPSQSPARSVNAAGRRRPERAA
jgi:hypothetical protein